MGMMTDANTRINLAAPLRSIRRHGGDGTEPTAATALPAYEADATSVPLGGAVPFGWEHRPGHPKSVRTRRPLTIGVEPASVATRQKPTPVVVVASNSECAREEDALSRDDDVSCVTVNCSGMGLSDAASSACAGAVRSVPAGGTRGGVMIERFLPAAHAVAAGSPQNTFRKAASAGSPAALSARTGGGGDDRLPVQTRLPLQHIAAYQLPPLPCEQKNNEDDDAESDAHSTAGFASKRCGLLTSRCVKSALLLSCGARRGASRPFQLPSGGGSRRAMDPLLRRSRNGQGQQPQHTGDDPGMQSWEEVYIKSLLRSGGGGGLMGPAAAVASELDRTVRELYKKHRGGQAVQPKASHLGLLLVLDRSNEDSGRRRIPKAGDTALLLPAAANKTSPDAGKKLRHHGVTGDPAGKYGFPLLLEDAEAVAGREMALSPQQPLLPFPLPKSPTESWLSRALPSVSARPPATSFLGLHVQQPKKCAPLPWCSMDSGKDVDHDRQRQRRVHDLQK